MNIRIMDDVVLFGADTIRSRAYLSLLLKNGLCPAMCISLDLPDTPLITTTIKTEAFDNSTPLVEAACAAGIDVIEVQTNDINSTEAVSALASCQQGVVIYSGPAGAMVKPPLFATGKSFIHVHPGKLPQYRGSTTMYYSLLMEEKIWVSALILNPQIDQGPVVDVMESEVPADRGLLDHVFDPLIRAQLMVRVLSGYLDTGQFEGLPQNPDKEQTYFVIHPVLKHIAILSDQS